MNNAPERFYRWLFAGACAFLLFNLVPRLGVPLTWDDLPVLKNNTALAGAAASDLLTPRYFSVAQELSYRPLSTFLHWAGLQLWGTAPMGHRGLELLLHLAAAWLLVLAFKRWGIEPGAALLAGAVFVLHPLHTETLFCVSFNEEILVAALLLGAWKARMRSVDQGSVRWDALGAVLFALALLSKETALVGLPVLYVLEQLRMKGKKGEGLASWSLYAAVTLAYLILRFGAMKGPAELDFPVAPPLPMRLYLAGRALLDFTRLSLAPLGLRLEYFGVPPLGAEVLLSLAGWAAAAGLLALAWRERKRRPEVAAGVLWAALLLAPTLNLIPNYSLTTRYFAERWTYAPLVGLLLAATALVKGRAWDRKAAAGLLLWLGLCGALEARLWSDERRLWARLVDVYPWSAKAHEGLGHAEFRAGHPAAAVEHLQAGLELRLNRRDLLLEYYVPMFQQRAAGRPLPMEREAPVLHHWLARAWLALGRNDRASVHMARAAELK